MNSAAIPYHYAARHKVIAERTDEAICISFHTPPHALVLSELTRFIGTSYSVEQISENEFQDRLLNVYGKSNSEASDTVNELVKSNRLSDVLDEVSSSFDVLDDGNDAPIVRLINAIINEGIERKVSDIHIETYQDSISLRFRTDGILENSISPPKEIAKHLISRVKVMAKMDIAEKRVPQDGKIRISRGNTSIDIRASTLPTRYGERVVLRILDSNKLSLSLEQIGFCSDDLSVIENLIKKPHGIIITTGPTGSGKTTTLYAALSHLNDGQRNILTIEDPVEYELKGVSQTQVNNKTGMTFANGLRAILRQDPDVVMIGEIRDRETAEIALQASLTGHLVLTTMHTNSAAGAITRLVDMGIPSYLLSSTLSGVLAQRLVRKLCQNCSQETTVSDEVARILSLGSNSTVRSPKGCPTCNHTGYKGRTVLFELLPITPDVSEIIHSGGSETDIQRKNAGHSILADSHRLLYNGITSTDEVLKVINPMG